MKSSITIILLLVVLSVSAQNPPILSTTSLANPEQEFDHPKKGNYAQDTSNSRDEFVGTWQYNQNGVLFQLRIFKQDQVLEKKELNGQVLDYYYYDYVILKYKLVKNGTVLFDNINDNSINTDESYGYKEINSDLRGGLTDMTRNVRGYYLIKREPFSSTPKIRFNLILGNYKMLNDPSYYDDGQPLFSIPTGGIEMIKIN